MANYNPELLKALANGDQQAYKQIKGLPLSERMAIGAAVDKLKHDENIIPMNNGFSIYEKQPSKYMNDEEVGKAYAERLEILKRNEAEQERIRKEHAEKIAKEKAARARALGSWAN